MVEFVMPILGADMEDGTLVEWRKAVGDRVQRGDIIAEVETDKGLTEVEVFVDGVLDRILVEPGTKVPIGTALALIREDGAGAGTEVVTTSPPAGAVAVPAADAAGAERAAPTGGVPSPAPAAGAPAAPAAGARSSPAARRRAAELGIDLARVRGSGPGGAIQVADVERAARATERPAASPQERMREAIATVMTRAKREIPHYYLGTTIDLETAMRWLEERNRPRPPAERLLPGVALIKAVALALREVPELNGVWTASGFEPRAQIHVGVAIALRGGGLVAPALHDTDRKSLDEVMRDLRDLVARARAGTFRSSELSDPTITVTNLGDQGVESVFAVIYPPQVAIVGFGKVVERAWVVQGQVVPRRVVTASLSADHRVSDGHRGARFLAALDRLLQTPEAL
jgi:pyruvate dehydrogenase E2 component (dihydrolipoamide acetyltransferase)